MIGILSGTCDNYVVYKLFENNRVYIRPLVDFTGKVDRNKFPCGQEYKFEEIDY